MCGSSSSPAPQPTQVSQVTIPEYAQPYAESMLGKAEALTSSPYQTYGGQRLAGPTQEQLAARQNVAGMEMPEQYAAGTQLAGLGGLSAMGYGGQGAMAGQNYFDLATNPEARQAFMSPYMQNVIDVQKEEAIRDAQKQQLMQNLGAARQGTYGGSRQLLAGLERERNLGQNLANIQASGLQKAYEASQQAQQFGSELGLRGLGLGLQGAQTGVQAGATLGQLGGAQQQSALDLAKAQEAFGAMGQQDEQKLRDLQYQDFLSQQQYPYKQLGFMSDILRGSANLAGTGGKTVYEAPVSPISQALGTGLGAASLYKLLG